MRNIRTILIIACIAIGVCVVMISVIAYKYLSPEKVKPLVNQKTKLSNKLSHRLNILPIPKDGAKNVPIDSLISIKLLEPNTTSKISVSIAPEISHKISNTNSLIVVYHENLAPGTTYTFLVSSANEDKTIDYETFSFTTNGVSKNPVNAYGSANIANKSNQFQLNNHPDIFLSNNTPYESSAFSIQQSQSSSGLFQFIVTSKGDKDTAKTAFISWAHGLGLSDAQLEKISISYR